MILIGRIINPHGVRGYIKIKPFTDFLERFDKGNFIKVKINDSVFEFLIEDSFLHKEFICLKLKNIDNYDDAIRLKGNEIIIYEDELKQLDKDYYYIHDLIGLSVFDKNDNIIGVVTDFYNFVSNDAFEIKLTNGEKILYPMLKQFIEYIDLEKKIIKLKNHEGMLE